MKYITKTAICLTILSPVFAAAQLVNIGAQNTTPAAPSGNTFHDLIISMSAGAVDLFTPEGESLSIQDNIYFDAGNWESGSSVSASAINLVKVDNNFPFFTLTGDLDIGYIGNESDDDNELYMSAYTSPLDLAPTQGPTKLFDYDADTPAEGDVNPPASYSMTLEDNVNQAFVQFTHVNMNPSWASEAHQDDPIRFKLYAEFDVAGGYTGNFLYAIADREQAFDGDQDDGFFFLSGALAPVVPEPSQIASLALLGMGALLYVRRRFTKKA